MKVFFSWSGEKSKQLATVFNNLLPDLLTIEPYFSPSDIDKGSVWFNEIAQTLGDNSVGILFITPNNAESPWIMFEAGALFKNFDKSRVCPLLFGLTPAEIKSPLQYLNLTTFTKDDFFNLVRTLNSRCDNAWSEGRLSRNFERLWPELDGQITTVLAQEVPRGKPLVPKRSDRELLEEVIERSRTTSDAVAQVRALIEEVSDKSSSDPLHSYLPTVGSPQSLTSEIANATVTLLLYTIENKPTLRIDRRHIGVVRGARLTCLGNRLNIYVRSHEELKFISNAPIIDWLTVAMNEILGFSHTSQQLKIEVGLPLSAQK